MTDAEGSAKVQRVLSEDHILNFPIPIDGGKACIVKVNYMMFLKNKLNTYFFSIDIIIMCTP